MVMAHGTNRNSGQLIDAKEFELPETTYVRDIENRVFQSIVLQCLSKIDDISLVEGNFIDHFINRSSTDGFKGITAEQDSQSHSVKIRIEIAVAYGVSIPDKAVEIQECVTEELTQLTGLHVSGVHVVFKDLISSMDRAITHENREYLTNSAREEEEVLDYSDNFAQ